MSFRVFPSASRVTVETHAAASLHYKASVQWEVTHSLTILVCQAQWKPVKVMKKLKKNLLFLAYLCQSESLGNPTAEGASIHFKHTSRKWHLINQNPKSKQLFPPPQLQPITSLSRTNYAECKRRRPSTRLCCHASLEGRSFIPFSTPICPQGSCSSLAQRASLLCLFICFASTSGCVSDCRGAREMESKSVWRNRCVCRLLIVIYAVYGRMCCFCNVCASMATGLIDHATSSFRAVIIKC